MYLPFDMVSRKYVADIFPISQVRAEVASKPWGAYEIILADTSRISTVLNHEVYYGNGGDGYNRYSFPGWHAGYVESITR